MSNCPFYKNADTANAWDSEEFESCVSAALISVYETKIKRYKSRPKALVLSDDGLEKIRKNGIYIPAKTTTALIDPDSLKHYYPYTKRPASGTLAIPFLDANRENEKQYEGYITIMSFQTTKSMPSFLEQKTKGEVVVMDYIVPTNDGVVDGERIFFNIAKNGLIGNAQPKGDSYNPRIRQNRQHTSELYLNIALQCAAQKNSEWSILAAEGDAKVRIACGMEEVKSLLYARSLPMTATGRKRPILHLVNSHTRRIRNGTEVDITSFLRGIQTVEIGGTNFSVLPPLTIMQELTENSKKYADETIHAP